MISAEATKPAWPGTVALIAILALAMTLRFYGLRWGLPNSMHSYSYHPDEFLTIGASFVAIYLHRSFDPRFYNYPSLYLYLSALAMAVGFGYGVISSEQGVYLCARVVTALMGVGAVAATYWAGMTLFNNRTVGLLSALFLCIAPLHVQHSHFATVDVPSTLFVALCLGYAGLILNRGTWRDYIMAGAMAGLAAGTKYNAGLVVLSPIAAHFLHEKASLRSLLSGKLWAILGCMILAFIISTPGSVLRTQEFLHGLTYEMRHASEGHGLVFAGTGNGFVFAVLNLMFGMGTLLFCLTALGFGWTLWKRDKAAMVILAFLVPYYVLISLSQVRFARYTLPMFPGLALLAMWPMKYGWGQTIARRGRTIMVVLWALMFAWPLAYAVVLDMPFGRPDPRDEAARWMLSNVPKGSSVGVLDTPWFYSPPLGRTLGLGTLQQRQEAARKAPYEIVVFNDYVKPGDWWTERTAPKWAILTDYETEDAQRLALNQSISKEHRARVDRILDCVRYVEARYMRRQSFGGLKMGLIPDVLARALPHDMRYTSPRITIYELKK
ncbi:MAG: glycosyltransferase family 39 protein [Armatimonadetes bacterium]|nr:glycosyltransferase family 39 protein [Armatimonadota bacterium]